LNGEVKKLRMAAPPPSTMNVKNQLTASPIKLEIVLFEKAKFLMAAGAIFLCDY
jgi:hypothetical protein